MTTIKVSTENGKLTCLEWNPELEDLFTVGTTDGALSTIKYSLDNRLKISIVGQIQMKSPAMCLSWSRKGKQLSIGDANGHLHQLKPELTSVRVVDPPANIPNIGKLIVNFVTNYFRKKSIKVDKKFCKKGLF